MTSSSMHIAVSGNIGSGKTTLTEKLAKHYGWQAAYESVDNNPYLEDFYSDMSKWAFHLQIYFLTSRFDQTNKHRSSGKTIIQDRTIYEDAHIFAKSLYKQGHFKERDYQNYLTLFESMVQFINPPDLLIYLKADIGKLVRNIESRGRAYESKMSIDYLKHLNEHYEEWITSYDAGRILLVDISALDFVNNAEDFSDIVYKIDSELHGLFS